MRGILKSTTAEHEFDLKSQVWFQTKITRHEVQLPLYYSHVEIAKFSRNQYFIDPVASLFKLGIGNAFTSHFFMQNKMMQFRTDEEIV